VQKRLNGEALESTSNLSAAATSLCYRALSTASTTWRNLCSKPDAPARKGRAFLLFFHSFLYFLPCVIFL
jgi:hypothetical protein